MLRLFDTHTHFDVEDFEPDREQLAKQAFSVGVEGLILIGFIAQRFPDLLKTHDLLQHLEQVPRSYLAPGLHPFYIDQHQNADLDQLAQLLQHHECIAIGEIGLDYFEQKHKNERVKKRQAEIFSCQLELAQQYDKPVLLHIRKAHADTLRLLKQHKFKNGGIAHAFSGGVEEAKAFTKLGFKIGVTGQITNLNAKRLQQVVRQVSIDDLVLETDCPDMTPICCQVATEHRTRNTPANLPYVLDGLSQCLGMDQTLLAHHLWQNTVQILNIKPMPQ